MACAASNKRKHNGDGEHALPCDEETNSKIGFTVKRAYKKAVVWLPFGNENLHNENSHSVS